MTRKQYRIVGKAPGIMAPMYCESMEEAKRLMEVAGDLSSHMAIQARTVTEWEAMPND